MKLGIGFIIDLTNMYNILPGKILYDKLPLENGGIQMLSWLFGKQTARQPQAKPVFNQEERAKLQAAVERMKAAKKRPPQPPISDFTVDSNGTATPKDYSAPADQFQAAVSGTSGESASGFGEEAAFEWTPEQTAAFYELKRKADLERKDQYEGRGLER